MTGRAPRQKGDRLEREIVKRLQAVGVPAKRVPLPGSMVGYPGDVVATMAGREVRLECKSRKDFKVLYQWLEHRDALILKGDRKEPLVVLRLVDLLRTLQSEEAS